MNRAFTIFCWVSGLLVLVSLLIIGLGDLFFFVAGGPGQTISYQIYVFSQKYPMAPFAMGLFIGILCGHLFWQYNPANIDPVTHKDLLKTIRGKT